MKLVHHILNQHRPWLIFILLLLLDYWQCFTQFKFSVDASMSESKQFMSGKVLRVVIANVSWFYFND